MTTNPRDPQDLQHTKEQQHSVTKICVQCGSAKPLSEFLRRTGRRSGKHGRRGTCRACRRQDAALPALRETPRETHAKARAATQPLRDGAAPAALAGSAHAEAGASSVVWPDTSRGGYSAGSKAAARESAFANAEADASGKAAVSGKAAAGARAASEDGAGGEAPPPARGSGRRKRGKAGSRASLRAQEPSAVGSSAPESGAALDPSGASALPGTAAAPGEAAAPARKKRRRSGKRAKGAQQRHAPKPAGEAAPPSTPRRDKHDPADASFLRPTAKGFIRMRGKTDNGRRWYQEVDPELAQVLVREGAAVVVNRSTIRRLFSSREFKRLILTRDNYTCHFCGNYGDTIDHKLPRAKGGHTTPLNCVCACYECNQLKANRDMDEFVSAMDEYMR